MSTLEGRFLHRFGQAPRIYQSPGRVNLIGEHTDYNDGFVLPAAIAFHTAVAVAPRDDRKLQIDSQNYAESVEVDLDRLPATRAGHWSDYVIGVAKMILRFGQALSGLNMMIEGNVPQGAGLSSSASLEVAAGYALLDNASPENTRPDIDRTQLALLCQQAENEFVGARCGIMDQFIASHGQRDHALLLDCRSLQYRLLPLPAEVSLAICNTMVKHSIAQGEYNQRRAECEAGVSILSKFLPGIRALRDVTRENLSSFGSELPEVVLRRCRHVVSENARVVEAEAALKSGKLDAFGQLMLASHRSLRDDFEVSCPELDALVELARTAHGVFGTRLTGGGFGGCTITLVKSSQVEEFRKTMELGYERAFSRTPEIYISSAADGVGRVS
jgi:galactokinase